MRLGHPLIRVFLRSRLYWVPALLLIALWIPGADQGWYRTDTHFYAAVAMDAFARARAAPLWGESLRALLFLQAAGEPYLNKPPLPFWIHGAAIEAFGLHVWSVRFPSLLAAIGGAWATAFMVARLGTRRVALAAVAVLATTVEYFRYTRAISLDLWMTLFMLCALALVADGVRRSRSGRGWSPIILSGVPLGLALLCKPFVALLAPLLVGLWLVRVGRKRLLAPLALSVVLAVAVAAPWHIAVAIHDPERFYSTYFIQQSLDRAMDASGEPWWFYLRILGESYWPWIVTLGLSIWSLSTRSIVPGKRAGDLLTLAALWSAAWLIGLTFFGGKAPRYLVPVLPLLGVFSAFWMVRALSPRSARGLFFVALPAVVAACLILAAIGATVHAPRDASWDALLVELDQRPGVVLYATPREHPTAANLVMLGRPWPPTARDIDENPPALLLLNRKDPPPGPGWRIVLSTKPYILAERIDPPPPP